MDTLTKSQLSKAVEKSSVEDIKGRRGYVNVIVNINDSLVKEVAVKASSDSDARSAALDIILDEPETVKGFILKDAK